MDGLASRHSMNAQLLAKCVVLTVGILVAVGNFYPNFLTWGFDHYVIGLPYGDKSIASFILIVVIATFPFARGRLKLYDGIYVAVAILAVAFLFPRLYVVLRDVLAGIDPKAYSDATEEAYKGGSLFFPYASRFAILLSFCGYLLWSLRLCFITWREILLVTGSIVAATIIAIEYCVNNLR